MLSRMEIATIKSEDSSYGVMVVLSRLSMAAVKSEDSSYIALDWIHGCAVQDGDSNYQE